MLRLIGSIIIGALLDHYHGRYVQLEVPERSADDRLRYDPWCTGIVVQVLLALKGRMPAFPPVAQERRFLPGENAATNDSMQQNHETKFIQVHSPS
jgi:hypothetical protein